MASGEGGEDVLGAIGPRSPRDEHEQDEGDVVADEPGEPPRHDDARLRAMVNDYLDFTWRSLRRLGLPADMADDATQRVFLVASRKLSSIAKGSERAFLFSTALRVASSEKRTYARRRETLLDGDGIGLVDTQPGADELVDRRKARDLLEELLQGMEIDLRAVFILFELEGLSTAEVATSLEVPAGTAASRLRRAREQFQEGLERHRARAARGGKL